MALDLLKSNGTHVLVEGHHKGPLFLKRLFCDLDLVWILGECQLFGDKCVSNYCIFLLFWLLEDLLCSISLRSIVVLFNFLFIFPKKPKKLMLFLVLYLGVIEVLIEHLHGMIS